MFKVGDMVRAEKSIKIFNELVEGRVYEAVEVTPLSVKLKGQGAPWDNRMFTLATGFEVGDIVTLRSGVTALKYRVLDVNNYADTLGVVCIVGYLGGGGGEGTTYHDQGMHLFKLVERPSKPTPKPEEKATELEAQYEAAIKRGDRAQAGLVATNRELDDARRRIKSLEDKLDTIKNERNQVGQTYLNQARAAKSDLDQSIIHVRELQGALGVLRIELGAQRRDNGRLRDRLELVMLERDEARDEAAEARRFFLLDTVPFFKPELSHCGFRPGDRVKHNSTKKEGTIERLCEKNLAGGNDMFVHWGDERCHTFSANCTLIPGGELRTGDKAKSVDPGSCFYEGGPYEVIGTFGGNPKLRWEDDFRWETIKTLIRVIEGQ